MKSISRLPCVSVRSLYVWIIYIILYLEVNADMFDDGNLHFRLDTFKNCFFLSIIFAWLVLSCLDRTDHHQHSTLQRHPIPSHQHNQNHHHHHRRSRHYHQHRNIVIVILCARTDYTKKKNKIMRVSILIQQYDCLAHQTKSKSLVCRKKLRLIPHIVNFSPP